MSSLDKESPRAIDAEESVLGACLISDEAIATVAGILRPADFYVPRNAIVYETMLALFESRQPIDLTTLRSELEKHGRTEDVGGAYLSTLASHVAYTAHVEHYAKHVLNAARRRALLDAAGQIASSAYEETNADEAEQKALDVLLATVARHERDGMRVYSPADQAKVLTDVLEASREHGVQGIPTGLASLDRMIGGLRHGHVFVIAARPSVGKTALAWQLAENVARQGFRALFVSVEMDIDDLARRVAVSSGRLSQAALLEGPTDESDFKALYEIAQEREHLPLWVVDAAGATTASIRATVARLTLKVGRFDLIVIDYLQLINDDIGAGNENARVQGMSKAIKTIARKTRTPVVLLSQLSRSVENRRSFEPRLSDLRDSGAIEQDADEVLFLWEEDDDDYLENRISMKIAKQRNGPKGHVPVKFHRPTYRFVDAA